MTGARELADRPGGDEEDGFAPFRYRSADGLLLYGRDYPGPGGGATAGLPLVCLPGLTRNSRDFHAFALAVRAFDPGRRIVTFDYRGRGRSERPADASTYAIPVEAADIVAGLEHLGIGRMLVVGTSRGALIAHLLAATHPHLLAGAVLNDAGPRLEIEGLMAIKAYVGRAPALPDWPAAIDLVARTSAADFTALGAADFERMARAVFAPAPDGTIRADYDARLSEVLAGVTPETPLPEMWELFDKLAPIPVLAIRGETSRLLSAATVAAMAARHPLLRSIAVAGQGHAPLLETAGLPEAILAFVREIEAA